MAETNENKVNELDNNEVNIEPTNDIQTEATNLRTSEPKANVTGRGLRAFLDDEEDEPQTIEMPAPKKSAIADQLKQKRPILSDKLSSFLDEDDDLDKKKAGSVANDKREGATEREVEDPMAELKATILNDKTKEQPEPNAPGKEDEKRFIEQKKSLFAPEHEELRLNDQEIILDESTVKPLTQEETNKLDIIVEEAKNDELREQADISADSAKVNRNVSIPLPNVDLEEENSAVHKPSSTFDRLLESYNEESIKPDIAEQLKQQRPVASDRLRSWLDEDDDLENKKSGSHEINKREDVSEREVEDPMAELKATIRKNEKRVKKKSKGLSREDVDRLIAQSDNALALEQESLSQEEKEAVSEINKRILSSFPLDKVLNDEEIRRIDEQVAEAKKDPLFDNGSAVVSQEKTDPRKITLPDVDLDLPKVELDDKEVNRENKEQPIGHIRSKVILNDDAELDEDEKDRSSQISLNTITFDIKENDSANAEKESIIPRIPDFYKKLGDRMNSTDISNRVRSEITDIIKASGFTDENKAADLADESYSFVKGQINYIYDKSTVSETKMSQDAPMFFRTAYDSLNGFGMSKTAQIITAQKIANVMLKNYSPVAFIEGGLDHYANDYVLNNRDLLKSHLESLRLDSVDTLIDNVDAVRAGRAPLDVGDTEFTKWLKGRIDSSAVYGNVYNELNNILSNAGFTDQHELAELVKSTQNHVSKIILDSTDLDGDNPNMHDIAVRFFDDSYKMIEGAGLSPKNRIITAQKISDVMLKNYSPVGIESEEFGQYAKNYVLGNTTLLRERLEKLGVQDIDTLVTDRDIANINGSENRAPDMVNGARLREKPSDFLLDKVRNGKAFTNIRNILVEAGIGEDSAQNLEVGDILEDAYSKKNIPTDSISMRDVAKHVFESTYKELTKKDLAPDNKIETAQKIADVILINYSPIIRNKALAKYANNYVINDGDLLKESLSALDAHENKEIAKANEENNLENIGQKAPENVNDQKVNAENRQESKPINDESRAAVYTEKLKAYNNMYKVNIDSNKIVASVTDAWELITSSDQQNMAKGQKILNGIFKDTLKNAFDVEKGVAYDEHRLPEYADIIRSTNELMRSAMYGFTDMYHNPKRVNLFASTAFGGLNAKDIGELTTGKSLWSMDQKSDEAWDIQAKEAKNIADKWLKEDRPYEKMINEMSALVKAYKKGNLDTKEMYNKLTAAEWLLTNNEKMMVENPEDSLNPIPNWGNRYWKSIINAREALGIPKHTSMRDLIQLDYAESAKAVENRTYNEQQIYDSVLDPADREMHDSLDMQKEQFATLSSAVTLTKPIIEKDDLGKETNLNRVPYPVNELNEREIMKSLPKDNNFVMEHKQEKELNVVNK